MYPDSPHPVPHEFLTNQQASVTPTNKTPWFNEALQLLKTPDLQGLQLEASTATETGLPVMAVARGPHPETSVYPVSLQDPELVWHVCLAPLQGQAASVVSPWSLAYLKALSINPPWQAWFPYESEQSTSCCSESEGRPPLLIFQKPSMAPVAEKAQHDPHDPWFLTPVTAPALTQLVSATETKVSSTATLEDGMTVPRQVSTNSSWVRWVN